MKQGNQFAPVSQFGLLIQGPPKTGKTSLGMLFPDVYVIDCNNNLGGAVRYVNQVQPNKRWWYDTVNIDDKGVEVPIEKRWERVVTLGKEAVKNPEVQTILIDTAGDLDLFLQHHILATKTEGDKSKMTIGDWVPYKNLFTRFIMSFRSTQKMLIMTCHEIVEKNELTGVMMYKPAISGKLQESFGGYFSDVWLTQVEKVGSVYNFFVKTMPDSQRAGIGNSLGLPENMKFNWDEFAKFLLSSNSYIKPTAPAVKK